MAAIVSILDRNSIRFPLRVFWEDFSAFELCHVIVGWGRWGYVRDLLNDRYAILVTRWFFFFFLSSQFALEIELYTGWSIRLEIIFSFLLLEGRIITWIFKWFDFKFLQLDHERWFDCSRLCKICRLIDTLNGLNLWILINNVFVKFLLGKITW